MEALGLGRITLVALSLGGRVAINYRGPPPPAASNGWSSSTSARRSQPSGRARVGQLMATAPERFETVDEVVAHIRANAPLYSEAMLRQRAEHAVRPLPGGGLRLEVRPGAARRDPPGSHAGAG